MHAPLPHFRTGSGELSRMAPCNAFTAADSAARLRRKDVRSVIWRIVFRYQESCRRAQGHGSPTVPTDSHGLNGQQGCHRHVPCPSPRRRIRPGPRVVQRRRRRAQPFPHHGHGRDRRCLDRNAACRQPQRPPQLGAPPAPQPQLGLGIAPSPWFAACLGQPQPPGLTQRQRAGHDADGRLIRASDASHAKGAERPLFACGSGT